MKTFLVALILGLSATSCLCRGTRNDEIRQHNADFDAGKSSYREKPNIYDGMTKEDFEKRREGLNMPDVIPEMRATGLVMPENLEEHVDEESERYLNSLIANRAATEANYDSRSFSLISNPKNQGSCGSCASFSATALLETCMAMANGGTLYDLSEQFILDCGKNGGSMNGCNGAWPHAYQEWLTQNYKDAPHENTVTYDAAEHRCESSAPLQPTGAEVSGYVKTYSCDEARLKELIKEHGAVTTAMYASDRDFNDYSSGVFNGCSNHTHPNHAVTVVGWSDDQDVWIVKNSWGERWGENGYVRVKKNTCAIGTICVALTCQATGAAADPPTTTTTTTAAPPAAATCDLSANYGPNLNGYFRLGDSGLFHCTNSICTPDPNEPEQWDNACVFICNRTSC